MSEKNAVVTEHHDEDAAHLASLGYSYDALKTSMTFGNALPVHRTVADCWYHRMLITCLVTAVINGLGCRYRPYWPVLRGARVWRGCLKLPGLWWRLPWSRRLWGRKWAWMNG